MKKQIPHVRRADLVAHFGGSVNKVAEYFDIKRAAVYMWDLDIPTVRAYQVQIDFPQLVCDEPIDDPVKEARLRELAKQSKAREAKRKKQKSAA